MSPLKVFLAITLALIAGACVLGMIAGNAELDPLGQASPPTQDPPDDGSHLVKSGTAGDGRGSAKTVEEVLALSRLLRIFATADPVARGKIVYTIRIRRDVYDEYLIEILESRRSGILVPAIEIAGRLQFREAIHPLIQLSRDMRADVRAAAIESLSLFGFWTPPLLADILGHEEPLVLCAALEATKRLESPPVDAILPLLAHEDPAVRLAAYDAVPEELGLLDFERLRALADETEGAPSLQILALMGTLPATDERDGYLAARLANGDWTVRKACLEALATGDSPLADPEPVWKVLENRESSVLEQVFAFAVLELRRTVDGARIQAIVSDLHPVSQLHAARCLVSAGDLSGVAILIDLLGTKTGPHVDDEDMMCAREDSRKILADVSARDYGFTTELWLRWYRELTELRPRRLESRPRTFW